MGGVICPECETGKHGNCNGEGAFSEELDVLIPCQCRQGQHSPASYGRRDILLRIVRARQEVLNETKKKFETQPEMLSIFADAPQPVPENDPGVRAESFPELEDDESIFHGRVNTRGKNPGVIRDLFDVEVQNRKGEWVPVVPLPLFLGFGLVQCMCGRRRFGKKRYQEHYAYAHILGMED